MRRERFGLNSYHMEVALIFENGEFHIHDGDGLAYCDIWADIAPTGLTPDDYMIVAIYISSQFHDEIEVLTGRHEEQALKILQGNEAWREWADNEVGVMTGYVPEPYDAPVVL